MNDPHNQAVPKVESPGILGVREISGEIQLGVYRAVGSGVELESFEYLATQHPTTHDVEAIRVWANYAKTRPDPVVSLRMEVDHPYLLELSVDHVKYQVQTRYPHHATKAREILISWLKKGDRVLMPTEGSPALSIATPSPQQAQKDAFQNGLLKGRAAVLQQIYAAREKMVADLAVDKLNLDEAQKAYDATVDKLAVLDELLSQLDQE
jgi:hypothetical protein